MTTSSSSQRGVAMLITLAAVVIAVVACASLARVAVTTSVTRSIDARAERAVDLLHAAEGPIQRWLRERSSSVVLPPDAVAPNIAVLDDLIQVGGDTVRLQVTAWDQRGMPPPTLLLRGLPIRSAVPPSVLAQVDAARKQHGSALDSASGLDLYASDQTPFPQRASGGITLFGASITDPSEVIENDVALGAYVATHNQPQRERRSRRRTRSNPQSAINVNTAPIELIEAAMRMTGRRGIEQIIDARERGEPASATGSSVGQSVPNAPALVATSDVWSLRIDATIGTLTRSWWAVYTKDQGAWRCVQRLAIDR